MIRVAVVQPSLAKYRIPVFRELASRPGIDLAVHYGKAEGIPNVAPEGFRAVEAPIRAAGGAKWQQAQVALASRGECDVLVLGWDLHYASLVPALLRARAQRVGTVLWGASGALVGAALGAGGARLWRRPLPPRTIGLLGAWAMTAFLYAGTYYMWNLWPF